ncbi:hypothetical protein C4D60_Mb00t19840 [Musa balbisiana]|uniref:Uncharacterized protein n=1 Tax=Musa balbisiana TaxID=52838 RepID=A0A4S8I347_MUSBA|nr:hypothetical protein C4D60_Mb00t19840 [Musa balbisiana]
MGLGEKRMDPVPLFHHPTPLTYDIRLHVPFVPLTSYPVPVRFVIWFYDGAMVSSGWRCGVILLLSRCAFSASYFTGRRAPGGRREGCGSPHGRESNVSGTWDVGGGRLRMRGEGGGERD